MQTDLNRLAEMLRAEYHVFPTKFRWDLTISASPLQQHLTGQIRPVLLVLTCAAGLVLLIACVNLANLLLARGAARQRELAVRLALGASPGRIFRQVLKESLFLALPGAFAGIVLAWVVVRVVNTSRAGVLLRYPPISMDLGVLAFTFSLTLAAALLFGVAPALSAATVRIYESLKSGHMTHSGAPSASRLRSSLCGKTSRASSLRQNSQIRDDGCALTGIGHAKFHVRILHERGRIFEPLIEPFLVPQDSGVA